MNLAPFIIDRRRNLFVESDLLEQQANLISWQQYLMFLATLQPTRQVKILSEEIDDLLIENVQRLSPYAPDFQA